MSTKSLHDFHISFVFPAVSTLGCSRSDRGDTKKILEESLASSRPTSLEYWDREESQDMQDNGSSGVIVGCQDGSVYVLCRPFEATYAPGDLLPTNEYRQTSPEHKTPYSNSGSTSSLLPLSALSPTFNVTAKPRVVSGVTTDPVEAPKNYVDFEDEPDKLKDILKGRNPKDRRSVSDTHSDKGFKQVVQLQPVVQSRRKNQAPRSLLSATNSRAPSPPSFSVPNSPQDPNVAHQTLWTLQYHTGTSPMSAGSPVKCINMLNNDIFFVVLHENSLLSIHSTDDGLCVASTLLFAETHNGIKEHPRLQNKWIWSTLSVLHVDGSVILIAMADNTGESSTSTQNMDEGIHESAHCVFVEFIPTLSNVQLRVLRRLDFDGLSGETVFCEEGDGSIVCFYTNQDGHLMRRELNLRPLPSFALEHSSPPPSGNNSNHHSGSHLPIPNPFKSMMSRSTERLVPDEGETKNWLPESTKAWLSEVQDVGSVHDTSLLGLRIWSKIEEVYVLGAVWTNTTLTAFRYAAQSLRVFMQAPIHDLKNMTWISQSLYALTFERRVEVYRLKYVDSDNEEVDLDHDGTATHAQPELLFLAHIGDHDVIKFGRHSMVYTDFSKSIQAVLLCCLEYKRLGNSDDTACTLWTAKATIRNTSQILLTSMLALDPENVMLGYSDGFLRQFSFEQMARISAKSLTISAAVKTSDRPLNGHVVGLHIVQNYRTRERYVVGGGDDGSIAFWSLSSFELVSRWIVFGTALVKVVQFDEEKTGPLRGCALCVSRDGSIAVIIIDGLHLLYVIPGSAVSLARICLGGNNLLLLYSDHRARLWDAQTKELWRSMGEDKAEEMFAQGGWSELTLNEDACVPKLYWTSVAESSDKRDAVSSLELNLEKFLLNAVAITKSISTSRDEVREILSTLERLRLILSALLTPGLSSVVDSICLGKLGAYFSSATMGLTSVGSITLYGAASPRDVWCISSAATAARVLAIVAVLRAMSLFEELTEGASSVISFFTTSLGLSVGPRFKPPSLEFLGKLWFTASNELRQSIRIIFEATIAGLSDEESISLAEKWQHHVPALQPDTEKETLNAALALYICGCVAAEKYSLLSINALMDISKSVSLYLHDEKSIYRVLAIELCSRGFNVWQHYVDALEILRSLFGLATSVRKESISIQNVGSQARLAVLNIAADNMPLFMGTLCLDILTPPSMDHRRSVLQILAFLIRKRPHVLQPNLPRLMEAVVKSLDPNSTSDRELVLDTATEIIGYVVKTFPSVDFHMATQRLAVGTNEGAVVMYDLKTAIRLYVLEGHKKPITALSFSPDGRRLVTLSLKESVVLAWKVGSSFASFFNPGAPPRQGHGGSQSFKTLNFNIGSEAEMSTAESIDLVNVEWVGDRTVKVKIRQSILTFST